MEKKDWKQRLGSYDSWAMNESMFITIDGETIYTLDKLLDFIQQELDKAREEVERKFVEKYHKRGEEMNVPYSEEDGKEFWQGYKEGYNQGLKDMIVDTYYLDKEFELKLKQ